MQNQKNYILHPFITHKEIDAMTSELAEAITKDYLKEDDTEVLCLVTLKGAVFFAADLIRKLKLPLKVDFIRLSSYGSGMQSSGTIQVIKDFETPVKGKNVLILDEIVDTGNTIAFLLEKITAQNPRSIRVATLLSKPSRREVEVCVNYCGREVEDKFLVGYGLDFNEQYRSFKDIFWIE